MLSLFISCSFLPPPFSSFVCACSTVRLFVSLFLCLFFFCLIVCVSAFMFSSFSLCFSVTVVWTVCPYFFTTEKGPCHSDKRTFFAGLKKNFPKKCGHKLKGGGGGGKALVAGQLKKEPFCGFPYVMINASNRLPLY